MGEVDVEICGLLFWVLGMAHGFSGFLAVLLEVGTLEGVKLEAYLCWFCCVCNIHGQSIALHYYHVASTVSQWILFFLDLCGDDTEGP